MTKRLYAISAAIFISILVLYSFTLHPFFPLGDSGEFIVVAKTGGVAHPPGFPLYALISFLIANLKIGSLVIRLNLLSAIFGALSVVILFLLVYELTKSYLSSLFAGLTLAISHLFWLYSIFTEVYTLSIFLNILAILLFIKWVNDKNVKFLYLLVFVGGLSLTVHYVNIFTLILIAVFSLKQLNRNFYNLKNIFLLALSFLLGLTPLLSIPIAASNRAFINWGNIQYLPDFIKFIMRSDYQVTGLGEVSNISLIQNALEQWPFWLHAIYKSFGVLILLTPLAFIKNKKQMTFPLFILLNLIVFGPLLVLFLNYPLESPYPDVALNHKRLMQQFHILSFPYIAILAGIGVNNVSSILRKYEEPLMRWVGLSALFGVLLFVLFANYHKIASARNLIYKTYGENILKTIDKPTILITGTEESNTLNYFYAVEGNKKNEIRLITFSLMQHKWYVDQLKERYTDISFPFERVIIGENLEMFYEENLENFSIVFAPLDSQASQSVSNKFSLIPYGVTVALIKSENEPNKEEYVERNKKIFSEFRGKDQILDKTYTDEATNETLMAYARALTNVALRSNKLGDSDTALFFLDKAQEAQPGYYTANLQAASIYIDKKDFINAAKEYEKVIMINPERTTSLRNLAVIYYQLNNKYKASEYGKKYLKHAVTKEEKKDAQKILLEIGY